MDLFYSHPEDCSEASVTLRNDEYHHLVRVMRKQIGDEVMVTDGEGNLYATKLGEIRHDSALLAVSGIKQNYNETTRRVTVAIGMLKNPSRMEYAIEKCTEIGVSGFIPLLTTRVIPHSAKVRRWKGIAVAAMKQSCRTRLPGVAQIHKFEELLDGAHPYELKLIAHEAADLSATIATVLKDKANVLSVLLCIGPEGGFTDEEVQTAKSAGFISVSLGERRLRTETAAVVGATELLMVRDPLIRPA